MRQRRQREQAAGVVRAEILSMNAEENLKNVVKTMHQAMIELGIETPLTHVEFGASPDAPEFAYVAGAKPLQPNPAQPPRIV